MVFPHVLTHIGIALVFYSLIWPITPHAQAGDIDYDIVFVRWPRQGNTIIRLPQGEHPYTLPSVEHGGCDLALLHPDGKQKTLVDCNNGKSYCCVQDPTISFDGEWVYYTKLLDTSDTLSPTLLYKMRLSGRNPDFREIQLTFNDGYTGHLYQRNNSAENDLSRYFGIHDMGPALLPGGKIAFTSNRLATIPFRQGMEGNTLARVWLTPVMQLYLMDDHNGELNSAALANLHQVGYGNLHLIQHPILLKDGRLLFSNWDDAGAKFKYAMTTLYAMNPDGTGLEQVTEPHDFHKNVDHFATQLSDSKVVVGQYYPSFDFGFGTLLRFPIDALTPAFTQGPSPVVNTYDGTRISFRMFDRNGADYVTPHTSGADCPAPKLSGKYAMPGAAPDGAMLVAYSPGGVNHFAACNGGNHHALFSGIYLIRNASSAVVTDPANGQQLVPLLNTPEWNEIWPRAVVPYARIYGVKTPTHLTEVNAWHPQDSRLQRGAPFALVGTSSLYNRESAPIKGDAFRTHTSRESHNGAWRIQGTDTGVVHDSDIHGVRIIAVGPKPFRKPIDRWGASSQAHKNVKTLLNDSRADTFVEGYASAHHERWKILGEFPVRKTAENGQPILDPKGEPDTSFVAKIPADTPFFIQGIDKNGMTLFSELTWRALKSGEVMRDCGGCHAHSIAPVPFEGTAASRRDPIRVAGLDAGHAMIADGIWHLADQTPLVTVDEQEQSSLEIVDKGLVDIEYYRDILPILRQRCAPCHSTKTNSTGTDLVFDGTTTEDDPYFRLMRDKNGKFGGHLPRATPPYTYPQLSKYVRANQARQSLLVWKLFDQRLDGRTNQERHDDVDFTPHSDPHGATFTEMQTIARWIDLGAPIDFQEAIHAGYRYTDDNLLPVLTVASPKRGVNNASDFDGKTLWIGAADIESGLNPARLRVTLTADPVGGGTPQTVALTNAIRNGSIVRIPLSEPLAVAKDYLLSVTIADMAGNKNRQFVRFRLAAPRAHIAAPENLRAVP